MCRLSRCNVAGVKVQFKLGGRLVGERTRRPNSFVLSKCLFVDDAALVCSCREDMVLAASMFDEVATEYGLTLSVSKTKLLVAGLGLTNDDLAPLELNGGVVEVVEHFKYLGSLVEACAGRFGMVESIDDLLTQYQLRWLGLVAQMSDTRHPKQMLFGWLPQKRPAHGAKLCWRDKVHQDLKSVKSALASHRGIWMHKIVSDGKQFAVLVLISM